MRLFSAIVLNAAEEVPRAHAHYQGIAPIPGFKICWKERRERKAQRKKGILVQYAAPYVTPAWRRLVPVACNLHINQENVTTSILDITDGRSLYASIMRLLPQCSMQPLYIPST